MIRQSICGKMLFLEISREVTVCGMDVKESITISCDRSDKPEIGITLDVADNDINLSFEELEEIYKKIKKFRQEV